MKIDNFLIIKAADIEIGKITVFIGPQASGKSIIAKLIFFFKNFISSTYLESIQNFETKRQLDKRGLSDFQQYFPKYTWSKQQFEIVYTIDEFEVKISQKINEQGKFSLKLDYSSELVKLHRKVKSTYKKRLGLNENENTLEGIINVIDGCIQNMEKIFQKVIFIPANRSFFANLQQNVFSFLANGIEIDTFMKNFGFHYESKRLYNIINEIKNEELMKTQDLIEAILAGKYKYEKEQDWILFKNNKINIINASSGQQESLPMLITLSTFSFLGEDKRKINFFIEEPEAHLFPVSQKHIMSLIALIYNRKSHHFVLTTHSPYILVALNNMILAHDISVNGNETEVNKIIDKDFHIKFEDVSAYTINNGVVETILDHDARLIGTNIIDSVSDEFNDVFDSLLQLQRESS
ncbi:MAG: AAA family ATPase [Thioploca sp.]|nr:AAA family ATPase [Thioploca sp.]